jgi:peptide/nickel transport system substrate-binding protein
MNKSHKRRLRRGAALGAMLAALLAGAAPARAETVLKVVPSADLGELDPDLAANLIGRTYAQMVFDTLFALDHTMSPKPMMVGSESISPDRLTYRFTLRPNLTFQDGSPVTTRDVIASLQHWMNNSSIGAQLKSRLASLTANDPSTFTLVLKQPFGLVEFILAGPGAPMAAIMRAADAERPAGTPLTNPIGSGPFRYDASERVAGTRAVFERFAGYQSRPEPPDGLAGGRVVKVDRVEWDVISDANTAANALVTGEVDYWDTASGDLIPFLRDHGITVRRTTTLQSVGFLRPNFQLPPFNDPRARQALALLVDQPDFMEAVAGDNLKWQKCYSFSVCGSVFGTEVGSDAYRKPDIAKAKQLLAEAGYHGEKIVFVSTPQLPALSAMAQVAVADLRAAGMNVDLQMGDWTTVFQRINTPNKPLDQGGYNLFASTSTGGTWFNPLTNISLDLSCGAHNFAGFPCDTDGEALRQKVLSAPDQAAQVAAFDTFQQHLWQFIPYVPLGQFDVDNAWGKNITGVVDGAFNAYWNIEKH